MFLIAMKKASIPTLHYMYMGKFLCVNLLRLNLKSGGLHFDKVICQLKIMGWTSGFLEITETSIAKHMTQGKADNQSLKRSRFGASFL